MTIDASQIERKLFITHLFLPPAVVQISREPNETITGQEGRGALTCEDP